MPDLLAGREVPYLAIYEALQDVRETFHREGRISDANAKLEETVKILAIHYAYLKGLLDEDSYHSLTDRRTFRVSTLNSLFAQLTKTSIFCRQGMGSIFGLTTSTVFEEGDENVAYELLNVVRQAFGDHVANQNQIDILNEAFGHHVRDNFRSNVEDAQYMTPPEVVDFMVHLALELLPQPKLKSPQPLTVVDPSCGVGSFLTAWRTAYTAAYGVEYAGALKCVGQDKVERMVRLTALNLTFSSNTNDDVFLGNTIQDGSPLSAFDGEVDLILTNPPFGARFAIKRLQSTSRKSTPFFANKCNTKVIDSELLFIDRYLSLLGPEGICFVVVPDRVVSAKGIAAILRQHLAHKAEIVAVVELPPVTFAQAGTRTKTAVLGFTKKAKPRQAYPVFFSEVQDIGFRVSKRKGVAIKKPGGSNQLPDVLSVFRASTRREAMSNLAVDAVWRETTPGKEESWTPRMKLFDRELLGTKGRDGFVTLKEYTEKPIKRKLTAHGKDAYFISVLHVIGEGLLDIPSIKSYQPVTPGLPVEPGEVIISRINPRIPRVAVVPDIGRKLLCSSEFEVLRPKSGHSPYLLSFVLLIPFVQRQIQSMTTGTSASHSRVRPGKVYEVLVPRIDANGSTEVQEELARYEEACKRITASLIEIERVRREMDIQG